MQDDQESLAALITAGDVLDGQAISKPFRLAGSIFADFLNGADNTCGIYTKRPFECSLYPFILSQTPDAVKVYVHLSCPYVQDHLPRADFDAYVAYLKEFFRRADIREFLSHNKAMFHDYSPYAPELLHFYFYLMHFYERQPSFRTKTVGGFFFSSGAQALIQFFFCQYICLV